MKFSGALLLWTAFTLTGMKVSLLLKKRENVISETILMLNCFISEIEYSKKDILSIIKSMSRDGSVKSLTYLSECSRNFLSEDSFYAAWEKSLESFSLYRKDEKERLLQLGRVLGTSDSKTQTDTLKLYGSFFENYKNRACTEYEKYGKVSSLFGLFVGASVFILFF